MLILITSDNPEHQMRQVIDTLNLDCQFRPFTVCVECLGCHRIYWRGTHWQAMANKLKGYGKG
jgi:uncharacterized protein with PIN domain